MPEREVKSKEVRGTRLEVRGTIKWNRFYLLVPRTSNLVPLTWNMFVSRGGRGGAAAS